MSDAGKSPIREIGGESRRPPSGPVSSPRAYFGRASRAAMGALRNGIVEAPEPIPGFAPKRLPVYRAGDPALRLFAGLTLPFPPTVPLTGAIATLSGLRDGGHERLLLDLGTSLVRSTMRRDDGGGSLVVILGRTQSAETYRTLLTSLRYVNDAPQPTKGVRRIVLQAVDAGGRTQDVASAVFGVGEAAPDEPALPAVHARAGEQVVLGETVTFNSDGDFTLFWWPRLLPVAAERSRRGARASEPEAEAGSAGSFFSGGGEVYRLFDAPATAVPARAPEPVVANDRAPVSEPAPLRAANDAVWMPGRGAPPPGFARARMLRLEDVFGSEMQDSIARRLIELRIAAGV